MNGNNLSDNFGMSAQSPQAALVPSVVSGEGQNRRVSDIFSRLLEERIILVAGPVTMESSLITVAQLLHLAGDPKAKERGIDMYIMSPGGDVFAGNAVIDTMNFLKDMGITVRTTAMGMAMSMGSAMLVNGSPGHRYATPSACIMLHEPSGGAQGKTADTANTQKQSEHLKVRMMALYAATTKMTPEQVEATLNGPDHYMYGEEAVELGIVDEVKYPKNEHMQRLAEVLRASNVAHQADNHRGRDEKMAGQLKTILGNKPQP